MMVDGGRGTEWGPGITRRSPIRDFKIQPGVHAPRSDDVHQFPVVFAERGRSAARTWHRYLP
jgi:hypothetical protein